MTKHFNIIFDKFDKRLFIVCDVSASEWENVKNYMMNSFSFYGKNVPWLSCVCVCVLAEQE